MAGGLPHTPELRHRLEDIEVSQFEPSPDALVPRHWRTPKMLMVASDYTIICL
jgi:hypothetical protein